MGDCKVTSPGVEPGRVRFPRGAGAWAALAALLVWACGEQERLTGTSTSVGTSIGGQALTADGAPAAGARVTVRLRDIALRDGRPQGTPVDSAVAGADGRFSVRAPGEAFCVEIDGAAAGAGTGETYLACYYRAPGALGAARLAEPGAVEGRVFVGNLPAARRDPVWVGIEGTSRFARGAPDTGSGGEAWRVFRVEGIHPGRHHLHYLSAALDSSAAKVGDVEVRSGEVTVLQGAGGRP